VRQLALLVPPRGALGKRIEIGIAIVPSRRRHLPIESSWPCGQGLEENESRERKVELDRMAAMLSRLGKRGYSVQEEPGACGIDFDSDSDFDPGKIKGIKRTPTFLN